MKTVAVIVVAVALLFVGIPVFACQTNGNHYGWSNGNGNPHNPTIGSKGNGLHNGWGNGKGNPPAPPSGGDGDPKGRGK